MFKGPKFKCRNCDYKFVDFKLFLDKGGGKIRVCPFCGDRKFEELRGQ